MTDIERLKRAFIKADDAGNTEDAAVFAKAIREAQSVQDEPTNESFINDPDPISAKALQGISFNLGDELTAAIQTPFRMIGDGQGPVDAFNSGREAFNRSLRKAEQDHPVLATGAEIVGALATGTGLARAGMLASTKLPKLSGIRQRVVAGAKDGAIAGGLYGAGDGEGLDDRAINAVVGGATGGTIGGALPAVGSAAKAVSAPVTNVLQSQFRPQNFATRKVAERLERDGTSLDQVQRRVGNGLSIADVAGEGTRDLLRTTTNIAGDARNRVATSLKVRQIGQGDRLKSAIRQTFADPDGFLTAKDELAETAKNIASPLYEKAYANPVHFSEKIEGILNTDAGKKALRKATEIASNEEAPFGQWFANIADDGKVTIKQVPDMRAWDYIKRGLDDVIESQTDKMTGKVTTSGRSVIGLKNRLLNELDRLNPDYAKARKAYAGVAQIDEALEFGKSAIKLSPELVKRKVSQMSAAEKEAARVGMAENLRKAIDDAGYTHNAVRKIMGNRTQYQRLRALFDNSKQFGEFRKIIFDEARKQRTFDAVRGNSSTARQLMDIQDAGQISDMGGIASDAVQGNFGRVVSSIGNLLARAGGLTDEVANQIATQVTATSPATVQRFVNQLQNIERSSASSEQKRRFIEQMITRSLASQTSSALAAQ